MSDDDRAKTHLSRLGVNPATVARLQGYADESELTLREFVRFVLSDYAPPQESEVYDFGVIRE
jgi:hypothetical protein